MQWAALHSCALLTALHDCDAGWAVYDAATVANLEPMQPANFDSPLIGQNIPGYDYGCPGSKDPDHPDSFCRDYGSLQVLQGSQLSLAYQISVRQQPPMSNFTRIFLVQMYRSLDRLMQDLAGRCQEDSMCDALVFEPLGCCNQTSSTAFRKNFAGSANVPQLCVQPLPFASTWVFNGIHPTSGRALGGIVGGEAAYNCCTEG